jgi:hypothetical protein
LQLCWKAHGKAYTLLTILYESVIIKQEGQVLRPPILPDKQEKSAFLNRNTRASYPEQATEVKLYSSYLLKDFFWKHVCKNR